MKLEKEEVEQKMLAIAKLIKETNEEKDFDVENINYYEDFKFEGSNLAETNIFIAEVADKSDGIVKFELYSGNTNNLIATVSPDGKLHFSQEYLENLREVDEHFFESLDIDDLDFKLPEELGKDDRVFTKEEREYIESKELEKDIHGKNKELTNAEKLTDTEKEKDDETKEEEENKALSEDEKQQEQIAKQKGIPTHSVLFVRENSNFYKDHPELEKNLYFYRDNDGVVKAEYIDSNGKSQPSKYIEPSQTALRQETISLGDDGNPVTREVPYQVMKTKGLNNIDKDIRDIRINVKIDTYGYLDIEEARQGRNGEWLSHDVEVKGRNYNSNAVNQTTSIRSRNADPDKQTEDFEKAEENEEAFKDGIQYDEMYLMRNSDVIMQELIDKGYQKEEAIKIFNYMIGEENLTMSEAEERVNEEIKEQNRDENEKEGSEREESEEQSEGRTPGDDAWERLEGHRR